MAVRIHPEVSSTQARSTMLSSTEQEKRTKITFRPSLFHHRSSTMAFEIYNDDTNDTNEFVSTRGNDAYPSPKLYYRCSWKRECIENILKRAGFKKAKKKRTVCCLYWTKHLSIREFFKLNGSQRVNHFPGSWCIGRKDRIIKCLYNAKRFSQKNCLRSDEYDFLPQSWILPCDYLKWKRACKGKRDQFFILKPPASSCGRGIKLVRGPKDVNKDKKCIIQRYIKTPYLINGKKFDLRLYVLAASFDPLRLYLFRDGLVRFATLVYSKKSNASRFSFLTNYSVNKKNDLYREDNTNEDENDKWSLSNFWDVLEEKEGREKLSICQAAVRDLIVKTMIAADAEITPALRRSTRSPRSCFELFGFDVLLDKSLKPWLLEVNVSPSLIAKSRMDKRIKGSLLADVFNLIGLTPYQSDDQIEEFKEQRNRMPKHWIENRGDYFGSLTSQQWERIIFDLEDEFARARNFECIYPNPKTFEQYFEFFQSDKAHDLIQFKWMKSGRLNFNNSQPNHSKN